MGFKYTPTINWRPFSYYTTFHMALHPSSTLVQKLSGGRQFRYPPHASLFTPDIFDWHYDNNPTHPLFVYSTAEGQRTICYREAVPAFHCAGHYVAATCGLDLSADCGSYPVVAILSTADTITTFSTIVGMLAAGITVFPITPVIAHLLCKEKVSYMLVSVEPHIRELAVSAVQEAHRMDSSLLPVIVDMPKFTDLYASENRLNTNLQRLPKKILDPSSTSVILHSSCSTAKFPKIIHWRRETHAYHSTTCLYSAESLCGQVIGCHGIELFHALGMLQLLYTSTCGMIMATFPPMSPAIVPTPDAVFGGFVTDRPAYILANPRFIQEWCFDPFKVRFMSQVKGVLYGGRSLSKTLGDHMVKEGVTFHSVYGATEVGQMSRNISGSSDNYWEYFEISPHCNAEFIPIDDKTYKLFILPKDSIPLNYSNTLLHECEAYDTGDLFVPHPSKLGFWKVLGRADDRVMLSSGEMVHPIAQEDVLCQHPAVSAALIFGQARPRIGVIIKLEDTQAFDTEDETLVRAFRNKIWPLVQRTNLESPSHYRIEKSMIILASPSRPFPLMQKGGPRRAEVLFEYQGDIDSLYGNPGLDPLLTGKSGCHVVERTRPELVHL